MAVLEPLLIACCSIECIVVQPVTAFTIPNSIIRPELNAATGKMVLVGTGHSEKDSVCASDSVLPNPGTLDGKYLA